MRSLRFKIITPFLAGSLILTVFLSYYSYSSAYKAIGESVRILTKAQTKTVYNSMSLLFRSMATSVEKLTTDPHVTNLFVSGSVRDGDLLDDTDNWFEILIQGNEYYRSILIVDKQGVCIASNSQMQIGVSYAGRSHIKAALEGEFAFGEASVGPVTKNLTATAAAPVYMEGEIVGAVVMVNDFPELLNYGQIGQDGIQAVFPAILSPAGIFISHHDKEFMDKSGRFSELYGSLAAHRSGAYVEFTLNDKAYVGYSLLEPTTNWVLLSSGIESEVFQYADNLSVVVLLVSVGVLCLISFVVIRTVNGVLNSLLSLIDYARRVSEGDLTLKLKRSGRSDELGVLHKSLRMLVNSMRRMIVQSQEASKMKSEFLANMSHEIRTPLNAVIGMTHLYLADDTFTEKKRDYIVKIQVAAKALLGIINNILDISKIEAGMFELDNSLFSLREAVEQVLVIHQENAGGKGLELSTDYSPDIPDFFMGDPVRIGQVLNNLTGNALKFTEKGYVRICCSLYDEADACSGSAPHGQGEPPALEDGKIRVRVVVADSGLGIPEDKIETLFKPFTQADASITRRFGGTGLGLAISEKIVAMMGGFFSVRSTPDKGTDFSFIIQLEPASGELAQNPELDLAEGLKQLRLTGKRILVAEDNEINQLIMEEFLKPTGAEVCMAGNGLLAVEAVKKEHFDLVFMDMQMPVMDGIQAAREIRQFAGFDELPIVAVTANAMKEDKELGFEAGLNDYITKPIEPQQLIMSLKLWIR